MKSKSWCSPRQLVVLMAAGWINRHQHAVERFLRSIKEECLDQCLGGALIQPANDHDTDGPLVKQERLGGLLNYYYREAA